MITISDNVFTNNWNAIQLNSIDAVEMTSNEVNILPTTFNVGGVDGASGFYITNSNGFHIENNNICSSPGSFTNGIFIRDCKAINEIYRNQFSDLYTGIYAMGSNSLYNPLPKIQKVYKLFAMILTRMIHISMLLRYPQLPSIKEVVYPPQETLFFLNVQGQFMNLIIKELKLII